MKLNTNIKKILCGAASLFLLVNSQCGYASDSDASLVKVVPSFLEFKEPGDKTVTIVNNSGKDLVAENLHFVGTQFTVMPTLRSITAKGFDCCANIPSGKSCSFIVNAAENATATNSMDGANTMFSVKYRYDGERKTRYTADFEAKISYNSDLVFEERNLGFTEGNTGEKVTQKLKITNVNPEQSVSITGVSLLPEDISKGALDDAVVRIGDYAGCTNLKSGKSCEVDINVAAESGDAAVPINVEYDVGGRKQVMSVAAVVIMREAPETTVGSCVMSGGVVAGAIAFSYANPGFSSLNRLYIGETVGNLVLMSPIAGVGYAASGEFACEQKGNLVNRITFAGTLGSGLSLLSCGLSDFWPGCVAAQLGCTFLGGAAGDALLDYAFPNGAQKYLPEDKEMDEGYIKSIGRYVARSLPGDFAVKALIRETCKYYGGVPFAAILVGAAGDTVAAGTMLVKDAASEYIYGGDKTLPMISKRANEIGGILCKGSESSCKCFDIFNNTDIGVDTRNVDDCLPPVVDDSMEL